MIALHLHHRGSSEAPEARLTPEVLARLRQAVSASDARDVRGDAGPLYEALLALGFARSDVLSIAASLLEHVARDVAKSRADSEPRPESA